MFKVIKVVLVIISKKLRIYKSLTKIMYVIRLYRNLFQDGFKYLRYSKQDTFYASNIYKLRYELLEKTHTIEKGLSARNFQSNRGKIAADTVLSLIKDYVGKYSLDSHVLYALEVLSTYYGTNPSKIYQDFVTSMDLDLLRLQGKKSGYKELVRQEVIDVDEKAYEDIVRKRASVRTFSQKKAVDQIKIKECVELANKSPSSCNRQATDVFVFTDKKLIVDLLSVQGGSESFKKEVPTLLLVTNDICAWDGVHERNQGLIDAGMYSMTLIHALTSKGLASCPLNLATTETKEKKLREILNIDPNLRLIMMIAVGEYEDEYKIGDSRRIKIYE